MKTKNEMCALRQYFTKKGQKYQIGKTVPTNFFKSRVHELGSRLGCGTHNEKEVEISRQNFVQYHDLAGSSTHCEDDVVFSKY